MNIDFTRTIIEKALWIVESEMARDTRQLVLDFSKLVMGDAENKLFVGPVTDEIEKFLPNLNIIAGNCKGSIYLCLIPHPEKWDSDTSKIKSWKFYGNKFIHLESILA